ncbi:MAG: nucleoside triphosphate pyrophosphohydrolase [Anaerolineae bacterium]|nr:nucleoside triphosphate pyrophosphohydrolase [Anaerolineae bacterium]
MGIIIVGLGPGDPGQITREAWQVLLEAKEVYLRTRQHPAVPHLPSHLRVHSFDHLYAEREDYASIYAAIAQEVLALAMRPDGVIYAVPGHPLVGETTTSLIAAGAAERSLPLRIVSGLSFVEATCAAVGLDPLADGLQVADAMLIARQHHPALEADRPAILGQLASRALASDVKLTLLNLYPDGHDTILVQRAGLPDQRLVRLPLYELDRIADFDNLTALYVPPLAGPRSLTALQEIVAHLRAPDGCPWDREQTHQSLRSDLLEETYEVLDALDAEDTGALQEELGDLLLHVAMHTQIAAEGGEFRMADVTAGIGSKLIRRHPHVFGDEKVEDQAEILRNWEAIKQQERTDNGVRAASLLDGIPKAIPALAQAQGYLGRAARVGLGLASDEERCVTVERALRGLCAGEGNEEDVADTLFALAALAKSRGVDAEAALRSLNARFAARVARAEALAREAGPELAARTREEQAALWESAGA